MDRLPDRATLEIEPLLAGQIVGHGLVCLKPCDMRAMRRRPGPVPEGWERVPPTLLRYSDEQTVAGVGAVFTAIAGAGLEPARFGSWGVVAASRFLGRANLAEALRSFATEGVWGTSPHLIPHFALHSLSGSVSLALGLHGPNLGVGGGLHATAEGFLTALTWLEAGIVPGVWLILTGWSPELIPEPSPPGDAEPAGSECRALALALVAAGNRDNRPLVRIVSDSARRRVRPPPDLARLAHQLHHMDASAPQTIATDPSGRLCVELVPAGDGRADLEKDKDIL
jgi:hypothetical protein